MSNTLLTSAEFSGLQIQIHDIKGTRWIRGLDVGRALGYTRPDNVLGVFRRHADEFGPNDTCTVNLQLNPQGGDPNVRLFSQNGRRPGVLECARQRDIRPAGHAPGATG